MGGGGGGFLRLSRAIDLWIGELARTGRTPGTRASYERNLFKFVTQLERSRSDIDAREVTTNDCRQFLDGWNRLHDSQRSQRTIRVALSRRRD